MPYELKTGGGAMMGIYLNPGNDGFSKICRGEYIDKTSMIALVNQKINGPNSLICVSRPRRFGKSYAAKMLCAYYDCTCDSRELFDDKGIASDYTYLSHLNQYNVIYLDITSFVSAAKRNGSSLSEVPNAIIEAIRKDLEKIEPDLRPDESLTDGLIRYVEGEGGGRPFVFIIDEWDALIREARFDHTAQMRYLSLLREWFKNNTFTPRVVAAAYMTGILPIKKDGSQSAISDFKEYTMLYPGHFTSFCGFTEEEVRSLCAKHQMSFSDAKAWYDGYHFSSIGSIYNPYSIMCAMQDHSFRSYWQKTSAAESLFTYINMDFDGLQETVARLILGERIEVQAARFENDLETFRSKDDVLTLLIHLGYLAYDEDDRTVQIPNEEVRIEFRGILQGAGTNQRWIKLLLRSRRLLADTLAGNDQAVAQAIERIRETEYAPTFYNDEQALRYVIKFAYIAAMEHYKKIEELPSGRGLADVAFIPKPSSLYPAMVIELKWNKTSDAALDQIIDRKYAASLQDYTGEVILVGLNYDEKSKRHTCRINRIEASVCT